jgi:hypothetical protein
VTAEHKFRRSADPDSLNKYSDFRADQILREWDQDERYAAGNSTSAVVDPAHAEHLRSIRETIDDDLTPYAHRRQVEDELADYIDAVSCSQFGTLEFRNVIHRMRTCRRNAPVGIKPDGGKIFAWDCKCGYTRLCPDEARAETQRLSEKYVPAMIKWVSAKPTRRLFYCVFTSPNFPAGDLIGGKRWQFDAFREFREHEYIRQRVKGALVVQEDPLSANDDWNVHLNVILCVEGEFDYGKAREAWGYHVWFPPSPLKGDAESLARTEQELVKYSAKHTGEKSAEKFAAGESAAPPMTSWPHARWMEWWFAQRPTNDKGRATAFRRTRSYGCLYKVEFEQETLDMSQVIWVGSIEYGPDGRYRAQLKETVHLIPEDNFSRNNRRQDNLRGFYREPGPPMRPQ